MRPAWVMGVAACTMFTNEDAAIIYGGCIGAAAAEELTAVKMIRAERRELSYMQRAGSCGTDVAGIVAFEVARDEFQAGRGSAPAVQS